MKKFEFEGYNFLNDKMLNRVLWLNGITEEKDAVKFAKNSLSYYNYHFEGTRKLKEILQKAKESNRTIAIAYDYDGDGENGCLILRKMCDYLNIKYILIDPERKLGFGLFNKTIDKALSNLKEEKPFLLLTVDLGGKNVETLKYARNLGFEHIVVIDHHDWQPDINEVCDAFINPHYEPDFPFPEICGAMTAYLVAREILADICTKTEIGELAEFAAIATVTDVMPLYDINRSVVSYLVSKVRMNLIYNKALSQILNMQKISHSHFNSEDIGFKIGPLLNASGRLESARLSVDALYANVEDEIIEKVQQLLELNEKRKTITKELVDQIEINPETINIFAFDEAHEGVIGIVAGNVTEQTGRPSFIFTKTEKGTYKGSGRSPLGYNLIEGATRVFGEHPELVVAYGGHAGAMGLTLINLESVKKFEEYLKDDYISNGSPKDEKYFIEYPISFTPKTIWEKLEKLEPYGEGLQKPIFHVTGYISKIEYIKGTHTKFYTMFNYKDKIGLDMLYFKNILEEADVKGQKFDIYFTLTNSGGNVSGSVVEIRKKE